MNDEEVCCPPFNPAPWNEVSHVWKDKLFLKDSVPQFLHIPLPGVYGKTITRMAKSAKDAGIAGEDTDLLRLAWDPSPWKSELFLAVTGERPDMNIVKISGTFESKVFDGPFQAIPSFIRETENYIRAKGLTSKKYYFYYTTCPVCAKKYGHNYIVVFVEV